MEANFLNKGIDMKGYMTMNSRLESHSRIIAYKTRKHEGLTFIDSVCAVVRSVAGFVSISEDMSGKVPV